MGMLWLGIESLELGTSSVARSLRLMHDTRYFLLPSCPPDFFVPLDLHCFFVSLHFFVTLSPPSPIPPKFALFSVLLLSNEHAQPLVFANDRLQPPTTARA